ncbi:MAG TPA: hypothetical protein VLZ75_13275 [Chitinophagales bacterium]|nr:hypothetical protein [Chitinophagales bacterium]
MELIYLKNLEKEQKELLKRIPALITILIGSADDNLDEKEIHMGKMSTEFRKDHGEPLVNNYFEWVSAEYDSIFDNEWNKYKVVELEERLHLISNEIAKTNDILQELDKKFAYHLVLSWRGLARAVANSSGGVLGRLTVSYEESELIGLNMITFN